MLVTPEKQKRCNKAACYTNCQPDYPVVIALCAGGVVTNHIKELLVNHFFLQKSSHK
jgi:hypothetical protein